MLLNRRYLKITFHFAQLAIHIIYWEIFLRWVGLRRLSRRTAQRRYIKAAQRFRALAGRMGGVLIKVGQFMSARVDVLPEYITEILSGLQDEVPAESYEDIRQVIESEFGVPVGEKYQAFEQEPLAAASLGQVHCAVLPDGRTAVVKVLRPGIEKIVDIDLAALRTATGWLKYWNAISRRADVEALLAEFSATLLKELDYHSEANNALRFAEIFQDDDGIRIPDVYLEFCTGRVLTLEDVGYIKITDYDQITAAGVDRAEVARRLLATYLHQIFTVSFFHADPHPGNLFVEPPDEDHGWRLVFVDFGMVGDVTPRIRNAGRESIVAIGTRDPARLVQAFASMGGVLPGADLDRLIEAETAAFDRFWGKSMDELRQLDHTEMHRFMFQFRDLLYEMPFQVPENLIYLGRCIAILSGMCTGLYPQFNLFSELIPFAEKLMTEEIKGEGLDFWMAEIRNILTSLAALPGRVDRALGRIERNELTITTRPDETQVRQMRRFTVAINRLAGAVIFAGLLAAGVALTINQYTELGAGLAGASGVVLIWTIFRRG
jgi:predicted unusual protein kinase regulating ubiquinone biosynthesis (AarF/ABC1/UbiB family)